MPFNAGEYVRSISGNWYGQVVRNLGHNFYRVRIGGTDSTRDLPESDLEFQMGRSIAPRVFPPVRTLPTAIDDPSFAYPFSNEKGFGETEPLWQSFGNIDPGAVVGVSGSVLDLAAFAGISCCQIVSTDINSRTTRYIDQLRKILVLISEVGTIDRVKRHWKTGEELSRTGTDEAQFFKQILDIIKNQHLSVAEDIANYEFEKPAPALCKELIELDESMKKSVTTYFSNWFNSKFNFQRLAALVRQGNFVLLCGDLANVETQAALLETLEHPITIFNISNALDYIKNLDPLINMFADFPHTYSAKVVSSSQSPACQDLLGSFKTPKVHTWAGFVEVLRLLKAESLSGALA